MEKTADTRVIRVDDDIYTRILAHKSEMEKSENRVVSINEALKQLLDLENANEVGAA